MDYVKNHLSSIVLGVFMLISVVSIGLFFLGGDEGYTCITAPNELVPSYTDALLYWTYAIVAVAVLLVIAAAVYNIVLNFQKDSKKTLYSLYGICALVVIVLVSFFGLASNKPMKVLSMEAPVDGTTVQIVDTLLYSTYILFVIAILLVIGSIVKRYIENK